MTVQSAAPSSFHASASMPSHISCPCILYRDGLYLVIFRCISFSRCVSLHLALSCAERCRAESSAIHVALSVPASGIMPVAFIHAHPSMQVLPCHHTSPAVVSRCIGAGCISLSRCAAVSRYILRSISRFRALLGQGLLTSPLIMGISQAVSRAWLMGRTLP
jgi:hypothetical protein